MTSKRQCGEAKENISFLASKMCSAGSSSDVTSFLNQIGVVLSNDLQYWEYYVYYYKQIARAKLLL